MIPNGVTKYGQKVYKMEFTLDVNHWHIGWAIELILRKNKDCDITKKMVVEEIRNNYTKHGSEFMDAIMKKDRNFKWDVNCQYPAKAEEIAVKLFPEFYYI